MVYEVINTIAILDYGLGNLHSIRNMLKHIEVESIITGERREIESADKLILPGVGSFDEGMRRLKALELIDLINSETRVCKKPLLGICLGMQLLGRKSQEGSEPGLNLIDFESIKFSIPEGSTYKIPHMGWEKVRITQSDCALTKNLTREDRFYFVHSYHALCDRSENEIISCDYAYPFTAAVRNQNVYGVQFHPEKSQRFGMKLLKNFAEI